MENFNKSSRLILLIAIIASQISSFETSPVIHSASKSRANINYCELDAGDAKELAKSICEAYKIFSFCSSESSTEKILLDQCCTCFDLCCASLESGESFESEGSTEPSATIIFPGSVDTGMSRRNRRSSSSKQKSKNSTSTAATGSAIKINPTTPPPLSGKPGGDKYNISVLVSIAVKEALNKFANALKNATEGEETTERVESETTTQDPCLEFSSGASKSQVSSIKKDIPKGLNCTELDPLDEFFPIKSGAGISKNKRHKRSKKFRVLPSSKSDTENTGSSLDLSGKHSEGKKTGDSRGNRMRNLRDDPILGSEDVSEEIADRGNGKYSHDSESATPTPKERPGKCQVISDSCISLGQDSGNCKKDADCPGTKKCCFYGCAPHKDVGVCQIPTLF